MELFPSGGNRCWAPGPHPAGHTAHRPRAASPGAASGLPGPIKAPGFLNEAGTQLTAESDPARCPGVCSPRAVPAAPPRGDEVHCGHRRVSCPDAQGRLGRGAGAGEARNEPRAAWGRRAPRRGLSAGRGLCPWRWDGRGARSSIFKLKSLFPTILGIKPKISGDRRLYKAQEDLPNRPRPSLGAEDSLRPRQTRARWGGAPRVTPPVACAAGARQGPPFSRDRCLCFSTGHHLPFKLMLGKRFAQAGQAWGPERPPRGWPRALPPTWFKTAMSSWNA